MPEARSELERGRARYAARDWGNSHELLSAANRVVPLEPADLELLATSAYMLGGDADHVRAHQRFVDEREAIPAARCVCWIGLNLALRGEMAQESGWFARA